MKICPVAAVMFYAHEWTDMGKLIAEFRNSVNALNKIGSDTSNNVSKVQEWWVLRVVV